MGQWLAVASERTELDFASPADSQQSIFPLENGSMRMSYLDKVRSISVVSAGGASGSSWSAGSSIYSSYCSTYIPSSTVSIVSHVSYSGASSCSSTAAGSSILPTTTREVASKMVEDGYIMVLIRMFGREPGVLERWFSELDVDWVLRINLKDHGRSSQLEGADDDHLVRNLVPRWTRALALMIEALTTATDVVMRHPAGGVLLQEAISDHEPDGLRLARFAEAVISKMLAFVGALVVVGGANHRCRMEKLQALINVLACVSGALETLMPLLKYHTGCVALLEEMHSLVMKIDGVLSGRKYELREAVTSMISDARDVILRGDSWETIPRNGEIHEATRLCADFVNLCWTYQSALNSIEKGFYLNLRNMIFDMIPELENQLEEKSQLIPDRSRRYIFLLNNSHFMQQMLVSYLDILDRLLFGLLLDTIHKVESYLESYLDVSWEPVLSCLHNEMPLCFPKHTSLAKFDSEFQRACSAQKLWKVPNPGLRKRLRKAIVGKVVTGYNNFLGERPGKEEDCSGDPTRSSSQDLEDMLNELFEG